MQKYFFCGIGGSGMSALAKMMLAKGFIVSGSDRNINNDKETATITELKRLGASLYPQNGSGIDSSINYFVVSGAVEDSVPDVIKAKKLNIPIKKRARLLADIFNAANGIAIGGTSGKTTTTALTGCIIEQAGLNPCVINGGIILGKDSNYIDGNGGFCVIEADESDGSIDLYNPSISVVTNISLDHKPLTELRPLFKHFVERASVGAVINADCEESKILYKANDNILTFSAAGNPADVKATNIALFKDGVSFDVAKDHFTLSLLGRHNIANALAAIAVADMLGIARKVSITALKEFKGVHRRMEKVGESERNGIIVFDDFAHNPAKIAASLSALKQTGGRLWAIYQPHGFGPTKLMKDDLINVFSSLLEPSDRLILTDIYYAGGTADKSISSQDIAIPLQERGVKAAVAKSRADIVSLLINESAPNDKIIIMGARDDTLSDFARTVFYAVS